MILLLTGSSEIARAVIATKILDAHSDWRHLALEDLRDENEKWEDEVEMNDEFGAMVACGCVKESACEGYHVVITCPSLGLIDTVREALEGDQIVSVHMDTRPKDLEQFDYIFPGNEKSVKESCRFLEDIIKT